MSGDRFLVTGSEGCIGSWAVKQLVERGEECVALDLRPEARRLRKILDEERLQEVTLVGGDITDEKLLPSVLEEHEITRIVHLAALQIPFVKEDPVRGALVNVVGTLHVFEAALRLQGQVRAVVYASSAAVYGPPGTGLKPATLYGVFKICNEESARVYWEDLGLPTVGLRPWAVYGPGRDQGLTAAPTHAMKAAVLRMEYTIPFSGRIDLQYAPDVAEAFVRAALAEQRGAPVYNLRGSVVSTDELVAAIEHVWPEAEGKIRYEGDPLPLETELDDSGLEELLGEVPRTELAAGVRETMEHFARLSARGELSQAEVAAP